MKSVVDIFTVFIFFGKLLNDQIGDRGSGVLLFRQSYGLLKMNFLLSLSFPSFTVLIFFRKLLNDQFGDRCLRIY